jgi:hypothetical protein
MCRVVFGQHAVSNLITLVLGTMKTEVKAGAQKRSKCTFDGLLRQDRVGFVQPGVWAWILLYITLSK